MSNRRIMVAYNRQIGLDSMETSILVAYYGVSSIFRNMHKQYTKISIILHTTTYFQPAYHKYQTHEAKRLSLLCSLGLRAVSRVIFVEHGVLRTNK